MTVTMSNASLLRGYEATAPAVFRTILAVGPEPSVVPVAAALARLAGARVVTANPHHDLIPEVADVVAIASGSGDAVEIARRLLDAGTAVLVVPPWQGRQPQLAHIGIAYDGNQPADAAFEIARDLADAGRGDAAPLEIAYVDDPAPCEPDGETLAPRRTVMIEWWLTELGRQVSAPVRPVRLIGEPAAELAQHSRGLDLLVVGARGGGFLRRALTGSVSSRLIATTRCPLLIVPRRRGSPQRASRRSSSSSRMTSVGSSEPGEPRAARPDAFAPARRQRASATTIAAPASSIASKGATYTERLKPSLLGRASTLSPNSSTSAALISSFERQLRTRRAMYARSRRAWGASRASPSDVPQTGHMTSSSRSETLVCGQSTAPVSPRAARITTAAIQALTSPSPAAAEAPAAADRTRRPVRA
jgi:nucleotide-binding universal stress UspA family protein